MYKKVEEIFSLEKINEIKKNIRLVMKDRYGDIIEKAEIAIGNFYNGLALIYIGHSQDQMIDNYGLEPYVKAQLAINQEGEFIKFKLEKGHEYYGFETYNRGTDSSLVRFELRRAKEVIGSDTITTADFRSWDLNKEKYKMTGAIFCYCIVETGEKNPYREQINEFTPSEEEDFEDYDDYYYYDEYDEDGEYIDEDERKPILSNTFYIQSWGFSRSVLNTIKLDTNQNTLYIIKNRYILLCDNMRNYMPDEYDLYGDADKFVHSYYDLFARYHLKTTDILENRYGVYDLSVKKTIIHVGEMGYIQAMISGFTRLDFLNNQSILTYDYFDIKNRKGIPYNSKLTYNGKRNLSTSCIDGREYNQAANIITDYWGIEETRSGKNAGEWYIIREGKNAGRTLCWLLANDKLKDILFMIGTSYLSFNNFQNFTYPSSYETRKRNKIWLALDSQKIFEEIKNSDDLLELAVPFSQHSLTKHQSIVSNSWIDDEPNFEKLIDIDTDYIVGLINNHCLLVNSDVFQELEDSYIGNNSYLKKLSRVKEANDLFKEDIKDYEERCEDEMRTRWEEEDKRYWSNKGYRDAFDGDPDAEWNID